MSVDTATTAATSFSLFVPGKPVGKGRPRFGNGRTFTDAGTAQAEADVLGRWIEAGRPRLEGAIELRVILHMERPKSHYRKDGSLSAEGLRHPWPDNQKPDVDNALKLVMDSLNSRAWADDVAIVECWVRRVWSTSLGTEILAGKAYAA